MRIGFLAGNHFPRVGGMEFATHFLAKALNEKESACASVACSTMREVPQGFDYPYPCYRAASFSYLTSWLKRRNENQMIQNENVNILHGPMLHGGGFDAMLWSEKLGLPFVAQSHGSDVQTVPQINYGEVLVPETKKVIQTVLERADHLIAVSTFNKRCMVELGACPEKISVIPNGIQYKGIQESPYFDIREKLDIPQDDFMIVTAGRNRPVKRMELLFEALKILKEYKQIKCLCVGPKENLAELVKNYGLEGKVILAGNVPSEPKDMPTPPYSELINAYRGANIYISTSYVESFGITTADALACGVPVVVGKNHGIRDILKLDQTGWVLEKETPEELAEVIMGLYKQRRELKARSKEISRTVSWLTWEHVADEFLKIYKEII